MEIRLEDYKSIQQGRLPDEMKILLQSGQSLANYQPKGGNFNLGQSSTGGFGGGFGSSNPQPQQNNSIFGGGGGIFGNKPASNPTGGSIFGQTTSPNTGGSFFGSNNQPNTTTPMFGTQATGGFSQPNAAQTQPTTSLFGGFSQNSAQKPAGTGTSLFGNLGTNPSGGQGTGLFSNPTGNSLGGTGLATQPTSIFGQQTNTQPGGGFFSAQTQPNQFGQGLMGKPGDNSGQSGGLFSNLTTPNTQTGGLFSQQPAAGQGGLFNSMPANSGGLFQTPGFSNTLGAQNTQPSSGLFQNNMLGTGTHGFNNNAMGAMPQTQANYGTMNQFGMDQNLLNANSGMGGMTAGIPLFSNSPTQNNNWFYHDWHKDFQNFNLNSYDSDDLTFAPNLPYKKKVSLPNEMRFYQNFAINKNRPLEKYSVPMFEKPAFTQRLSQTQNIDKKPKDFIDKEPSVLGSSQLSMMNRPFFANEPKEERRKADTETSDKQIIKGI